MLYHQASPSSACMGASIPSRLQIHQRPFRKARAKAPGWSPSKSEPFQQSQGRGAQQVRPSSSLLRAAAIKPRLPARPQGMASTTPRRAQHLAATGTDRRRLAEPHAAAQRPMEQQRDGAATSLPPRPRATEPTHPRQTAATVMGARLGGRIARLCPRGCTWRHKAGPDLAEPWQWGEDGGVLVCIAFAHPVFTKPSLSCVLRLTSQMPFLG